MSVHHFSQSSDGLTKVLLILRAACMVVYVLANTDSRLSSSLATRELGQPCMHKYDRCHHLVTSVQEPLMHGQRCGVRSRTLITARGVRLNCMRHSSAGPEYRLLWILPRNPQHPHCSSTLHSVPVLAFALLIVSGGHLFIMSKMWEVDPETRSKVRCGVSLYAAEAGEHCL